MKSMTFPLHWAVWFSGLPLVLGLFGATVSAEEALAPPQKVIQSTANQLQVSLQKPEYKADFKKATTLVDQIINPHIDFDRVSVLVLGQHWRKATPEQKIKFKKEFRMLLVRTYTTAFTEYSDWKIRYLPLETDGSDKKAMVKTEILQAGGQPVAVNYRMINDGANWKVYDVLIEGISLLQNYRTSFGSEIEETGSLDKLIVHLEQRNATALKEPMGQSGS
jgi:phospholipid transport system substrate-binding protein